MKAEVIIAGAGFGGLSCAKATAKHGLETIILERKNKPGIGLHTTGIIVKEAVSSLSLPQELTHQVKRIRLFSPSLKEITLHSDDYFFLATDTPKLMEHLSREAEDAGAKIMYDTPYISARYEGDDIIVNDNFSCKFLVGADGARSKVAKDFGLGINKELLTGVEAEYKGLKLPDSEAFYCFISQKLAPGYIGWVIPGVGITQVGVASRTTHECDINRFIDHISHLFDFSSAEIVARRGGLIPVGGLVTPFAKDNVILLGDAAGIVSPLTAGGIHTALHFGNMLGEAITNYIRENAPHPSKILNIHYPRFRLKLFFRKAFDLIPDWLINIGFSNPIFKIFAESIFFKQKKLKG